MLHRMMMKKIYKDRTKTLQREAPYLKGRELHEEVLIDVLKTGVNCSDALARRLHGHWLSLDARPSDPVTEMTDFCDWAWHPNQQHLH
jgi:hypothetical protein